MSAIFPSEEWLKGLEAKLNSDEKYSGIVRFVVTIVGDIAFSILGSIVVNYYSRQREFRADAGGAQFSSRENMIGALKKLQAAYEQPFPADESATATLMISNRKKSGWAGIFMTHPPLEDRIMALQRGGKL